MIISRVVLENFGLYKGKQEFNFQPEENRNIVLIGGENGNGKTTLFEAIRFCLYGPATFEKRLTANQYQKKLLKYIHRSKSKVKIDHAAVEIEFCHNSFGTEESYLVRREWRKKGSGIKETLSVRKDGGGIDTIESEHWQDFVNDLIPKGLSRLFFFDGEKIQKLASDISSNEQLAESFNSLLGIDLVERLQSDLDVYMLREMSKNGAKSLRKEHEKNAKIISHLEQQISDLSQKRAAVQTKLTRHEGRLEDQENKLKREGGGFALKREELKEKVAATQTALEIVQDQIRSATADMFPLFIAIKTNKVLLRQLESEEKARAQKEAKRILEEKARQIQKLLVNKKIRDKVLGILRMGEIDTTIVHGLSLQDHPVLISLLGRLTRAQQQFSEMALSEEKLSREQHKLQKQLTFAPKQQVLEKYFSSITELHRFIARLAKERELIDEEISSLERKRDLHKRAFEKVKEKIRETDATSNRVSLASKAHKTLELYRRRLKEQRVKDFSTKFIQNYSLLARKKEAIIDIDVNPDNFEVILYKPSENGRYAVSRDELSAGEKQIYAIAVLWTLTNLSNRSLPFIIDTPLGRLDNAHKNTMTNQFFKKASHQFVILSTDTEVDQKYFNQIAPSLARAYKLDFKDKHGYTGVVPGYFWEEKHAKV